MMSSGSDFFISEEQAIKEIGTAGRDELLALQRHLKLKGALRYRYSPSLSARSEAQLFGVSTPRFALRAYLDPEYKCFVNARRIVLLEREARHWVERRNDPGWTQLHGLNHTLHEHTPGELIRSASRIGDSLLSASSELRQTYHVMEADLGREYGEVQERTVHRATPFINHIEVAGGGLCAQACCLMAVLVCQEHFGVIHSVPEISTLLQSTNEVILKGLIQTQIRDYFNTWLHASTQWQRAVPFERTDLAIRVFGRALRSYVASGFPVILPCDLGRMQGWDTDDHPVTTSCGARSIYERNGIPTDARNPGRLEPRHHAVLAVGCSRDEASCEFLLNDPASFPFVMASSSDLWHVAMYNGRDAGNAVIGKPNAGWLLPLTPPAVRLPLMHFKTGELENTQPYINGLFRIAETLQVTDTAPGVPRCAHLQDYDAGHWRLARVSKITAISPFADTALLSEVGRVLGPNLEHDDHWCWVQHIPAGAWGSASPERLWVWDAEEDPPVPMPALDGRAARMSAIEAEKYLLLVLERKNGSICKRFESKAPKRDVVLNSFDSDNYKDDPRYRECLSKVKILPQKSLITSFTLAGLSKCSASWPRGLIRAAELYTLMEPDAHRLLQPWLVRKIAWLRHRARKSALDCMAESSGNPRRIRKAAQRIHVSLKESPIIAMATFLPELSSVRSADSGRAIAALRFAISLAIELQAKRHPITVIELVGGSVIEGIWYSGHPGKEAFVANRFDAVGILKTLCENLEPAVEQIRAHNRSAQQDGLWPIYIGVEVEPGPLNAVRDLDTLIQLCDLIDDHKLSDIVGLNLDVSHFRLASITREELWRRPNIYQRIVHAHMSDCGLGHFGDAVPGSIHSPADFQDWLEFLAVSATERGEGAPRYSGYVSLEFEACRDPFMLRTACQELARL